MFLLFVFFPILVIGQYYELDAAYPLGLKDLNVSQVTAVAVVNTSQGSIEIHVAQRGTEERPFIVLDANEGRVIRTYGEFKVTLESPHGMVSSIGVGAPGPSTLWVADIVNGTLLQLNPETGEVLELVGSKGLGVNPPQFSAPADIALDGAGGLWCSDGDGGQANRVMKLYTSTPNSKPSYVLGCGNTSDAPGCFSSPHSVSYSSRFSHVWVVDRGNNRLQVFAAGIGTLLGEWTAQAGCFGTLRAQPWGIRVDDSRGRILVADGGPAGNPSGGEPGVVYALEINSGAGWSKDSIGSCQGALLQTLSVPSEATAKPHELAVDPGTGDVYLADIGVPPSVRKYRFIK